ncbi:hypothetical protein [Variovorax sp. PAMC 28711]|uniref:hypothetical protein n=1 Tax=Variovorax sp. PAMC 28711 TaxID=1795631 RepID=UPI00078D9978|nr:hypothetical protein [Variovorax sp. PAMC 28711]AMM23013.1 hypothetical protein AX767_00415 [Variovorax sp. PAMC 28711]
MSANPFRALHPVFDWRETPAQIDWSDVHKSKKLSTSSSAKVSAELAAGVNNGTIHGISKRADAQIANVPHGGAYGRAVPRRGDKRTEVSDTQKLRRAMVAGPATTAELAIATGINRKVVPALLQYDMSVGRVVQLRDTRPYRYELAAGEGCFFVEQGAQAKAAAEAVAS